MAGDFFKVDVNFNFELPAYRFLNFKSTPLFCVNHEVEQLERPMSYIRVLDLEACWLSSFSAIAEFLVHSKIIGLFLSFFMFNKISGK
jgi:hypothetical protein